MKKQKTNKSKKSSKKEVEINDNQEPSNYTAEFFNDKQLKNLKYEETKSQLLEFLREKKLLGTKTFREVKSELRNKFGNLKVESCKEWLINTLNSRKSGSKSNTPSKNVKKGKQIPQQAASSLKKKSSTIKAKQQDPESKSNTSQKNLQSEQQIQFDLEQSNSSSSEIINTYNSKAQADIHIPNMEELDEMMSSKLQELSQNAMKDLYDKLLRQIPDVLETKLFEKLSEQVNLNIDKIKEFEQLIREINIPAIQQQTQEGKEEIQNTFHVLVEDIKKAAPSIGIATQESLAKNMRRIDEQLKSLLNIVSTTQKKLQQSVENQDKIKEELSQKLQPLQENLEEFNQNNGNANDLAMQAIADHKKLVDESLEVIHTNIQIVNNRITNIEKKELKHQVEQALQRQQQLHHQDQIEQQSQQEQNSQREDNDLIRTIEKYNSGDLSVRFIYIDNKAFIHDKMLRKIIQVQEEIDN